MTGPEVVSALAQRLGLPSLTPDETGLYALRIDADLPVFIQAGAEDTGVILFAGIGSVPPEQAGGACRGLLEANNFGLATGGFNLSLVPGTLNVLLSGRAALAGLDGALLFDLFDHFVTAASTWRQRLPSIVEESPGHTIGDLMDEGPFLPGSMPGPGDLV
jgi:hypothetical protein